MIESVTIRPILPDELEAVARIRAIGFGSEAKDTLTAIRDNPRYDFAHMIAAEYKGEIIGTATIFPAQMWLSGVPLSLGAVAGVAVLPDYRQKGVAAKMMEFAVMRMVAEGRTMSALFPFSPKYYRQFGYGPVSDLHFYRFTPANLIDFPESDKVRPFEPDDLRIMRVLYKGQLTWHNGWFTRSNEWWDRLIQRWPNIKVYDNEGMIEGYYAYEISLNQAGKRVLNIKELFAAEDEAYRGLMGYLAVQTEADIIEYLAPADTPLHHTLRQPWAYQAQNRGWVFHDLCHVTPGMMARIINLPAALTSRFYTRGVSGEKVLQISDPLIPTNEEPLVFRVVDGRAETKAPDGRQPDLQSDITTFTQVLCGYLKAVDARRIGRLQADDETCSWLERVIVDAPLYVQAGDWF